MRKILIPLLASAAFFCADHLKANTYYELGLDGFQSEIPWGNYQSGETWLEVNPRGNGSDAVGLWLDASQASFNLTVAGSGFTRVGNSDDTYSIRLFWNAANDDRAFRLGPWEMSFDLKVKTPEVGLPMLTSVYSEAYYYGSSRQGGFTAGIGNYEPDLNVSPFFYAQTYTEENTGYVFDGWKTSLAFTVPIVPDINDPTTWGWVMNFSGHGPDPVDAYNHLHGVPDSGNTLGFLGIGLVALLGFKATRKATIQIMAD